MFDNLAHSPTSCQHQKVNLPGRVTSKESHPPFSPAPPQHPFTSHSLILPPLSSHYHHLDSSSSSSFLPFVPQSLLFLFFLSITNLISSPSSLPQSPFFLHLPTFLLYPFSSSFLLLHHFPLYYNISLRQEFPSVGMIEEVA
ncbi:hypothetical protein Pcinc_042790 [Petrolisthes cinctipes]|uniref:Uncharacterized protein n=1 Tax=Petrolisthes cinctipes TaxID=88211 RepID=A0AAE1EFP3_PETCI|nr:hypothetical protein Pcinc_042790 [Petrolisthes cinctipes]